MYPTNSLYTEEQALRKVYPAKPLPGPDYRRKVLLLIAVFSLIRTLIAFAIELGNDEAYYWFYSQKLQWNYFDHPPVIALWIRIFTANLELQHIEGFVRLGSVIGGALSTWFLYRAVSLIHNERAGWLAACLYNASFYAGMIAGIFIWPDSPQMVFWTLSLWMIARIVKDDRSWTSWLLLGAAAGICIMCKVHGVFIWAGFGLFIVFRKREWFLRPQLYAAIFLTLLIASPILIWNIRNDFMTYRFHSQRVTINKTGINPESFGRELLGQFLLNNPFNVLLTLAGLAAFFKRSMERTPALQAYNFIGLPLVVLLLFVSLFRETYAHWSGPAYVSLIPLAAIRLSERKEKRLFPPMARRALAGCLAFFAVWQALVHFYPGTTGSKAPLTLGAGDVTLDLHGWERAGKEFAALYRSEREKGLMPTSAPVVAYKWWGAHIDYYFCRPAGAQLIGLGAPNDAHHYLWSNDWRGDHINMTAAYCIVPSDEYYNVKEKYGAYYSRIEPITSIEAPRNGRPAHRFHIFRLTGWKGGAIPEVDNEEEGRR